MVASLSAYPAAPDRPGKLPLGNISLKKQFKARLHRGARRALKSGSGQYRVI